MAYTFRPSKSLTDSIATIAEQLERQSPKLTVSIATLYEYGARRLLHDYQRDPGAVAREFRAYLSKQSSQRT